MNTNTNPAAASVSSSRDNPCYGSDPTVATLNVFADDERSYQLPYAQFLYAEMIPNPALEKDADAPPEKMLTLPCLPGRLTPAETAWRLGFEPDHIPILVNLGLLKPLGRPPASSVKYFASIEIEALRNDPKWLAKASDALRQKWKIKNDAAKKRSGNGHSITGNGQLAHASND